MIKALIVYGTRYGATAGTAQEMGKVLSKEGFDVKVIDAKKEKVDDVSPYDLVIVGSGMMAHRWTKEPEDFMKKYQKQLAKKKVALFVSSGAKIINEYKKDEKEMKKAWDKYLVEKAEKYSLKPVDMAIFGGWYRINDMGWMVKKTAKYFVPELEAAGVKGVDGVYDTRDWNEIRKWTKELAKKARS